MLDTEQAPTWGSILPLGSLYLYWFSLRDKSGE